MASDGEVPKAVLVTERRHNRKRIQRIVTDTGALKEAIASPFGTDFDRSRWDAAYASTRPSDVNRVSAVIGAYERIVNGLVESARSGLIAAGLEARADRTVPADLRRVRDAGGLTERQAALLIDLSRMRNQLQHDYIDVTADDAREAVRALAANVRPMLEHLTGWLDRHGVGVRAQ